MTLAALWRRTYTLAWVVLPPAAGVGVLGTIVAAALAPREVVEGDVQRVFYIHFPSIMSAYLAFGIVCLASIVLLWRRDMRWDAVARAAATVGVLFTGLTLATGMLWGKPIWGVYWTWDARLTSTLVLFLIYVAYLLARSMADELDEQAARYAAVFAIIGTLDIPLVMMSVRWWRTLHPQPIVLQDASAALPGQMLLALLVGTIGITLLALWLMLLRGEAERLSQRAAALRATIDRHEEA